MGPNGYKAEAQEILDAVNDQLNRDIAWFTNQSSTAETPEDKKHWVDRCAALMFVKETRLPKIAKHFLLRPPGQPEPAPPEPRLKLVVNNK